MDRTEVGRIILLQADAGALQVDPMLGFEITGDGGLSFVNDGFTYPAYVDRWTRIRLYASPSRSSSNSALTWRKFMFREVHQ